MLKVLRKKGVAKKILWVVAIIIIISFGFLGQSYIIRQTQHPDYAGRVFGKKVSIEEFQRNLTLTQMQAMIQYGDNFAKIRQYLNLVSQAWDRIILLHEVNRRRIQVTDQEVIASVQKYSIFQRDNRFDRQLYYNILNHVFKITPREFEEAARENLKFFKLFEQETFDVTVPEQEIFDAFRLKNDKAQVSYVLIDADALKGQVVYDENQAKDFYQSHKDEFILPPMIKVEYLSLDFPAHLETETLTETEKDAVFSKALDVTYELNNNPDFNKAAEKFGLTVKTSDYFDMEQPDIKQGWSYPTLQKIFQLEDGKISEPLETATGYQIVRIADRKDAYVPDYEQARDKVKEAWIHNEAMKLSKKKAEEYLQKIQDTLAGLKRPDFAKVAKELGLELSQTPVFSRGEYLPKIGISRDFQDSAFALTLEKPLSSVVETAKGYGILYLDSHIPVSQEDFQKEKETFSQQILTEKRNAIFSEFVARLRLQANLEDHVAKIMASQGKQ
jgi:peptidyl-prolyl cis-trans isomerase D